MFPFLLLSIVFAPVLLGVLFARRRGRAVWLTLLTVVFVYDVVYMFMLDYLRYRWVG